MGIGENIRRLRERMGLSQAELGAVAGVTDKAVSSWETGTKKPRMSALQKIADNYHIPVGQLVDDGPAAASDDALKFALFGDAQVDDAVFEEVKHFAQFAKERYDREHR